MRWVRRRPLLAGLGLAAVAVMTLPDLLFGLDRVTPFTQLVAVRPHVLAAVTVLAALTAAVAMSRRGGWPVAVVLVVIAVLGGAMVAPGTVGGPAPVTGKAADRVGVQHS